ncbi:MAG: thioesterase [Spirochaetales bacterium]|nr:thioesterase [Spirochaetales bacterium]
MVSVPAAQPAFRRTIQIGYRSVIQDGLISPALLWEELEESAEQHCRLIGLDVFTLLKRQEAWALKSGASRMYRYPGYGEKIEIVSWISSLERYRGYREFRILDEEGAVLGEMSTLWIYMDLKERRLQAIPEEFHTGWGSRGDALHHDFHRKSRYHDLDDFRSEFFPVRRRDLDSSAHVHNIRYLEWMSESVPEQVYRHCRIEEFSALFRREMRSGGCVEIRTHDLGDGCFRHDYFDRDRQLLLCSAESRWVKKESRPLHAGILQKVI